jgi:hypothetical protein
MCVFFLSIRSLLGVLSCLCSFSVDWQLCESTVTPQLPLCGSHRIRHLSAGKSRGGGSPRLRSGAMLPAGCGWCVQTVAKIDRSRVCTPDAEARRCVSFTSHNRALLRDGAEGGGSSSSSRPLSLHQALAGSKSPCAIELRLAGSSSFSRPSVFSAPFRCQQPA